MSSDPLDIDRRSLVVQADHVQGQLDDARAWPHLRRVGVDPVSLAERTRAANAAARVALAATVNAGRNLRALQLQVPPLLQPVKAWQVEVRTRLRLAPATDMALLVVRELRELIAPAPARLVGTIAMLRAASDRLRDHQPTLVDVPADQLGEQADRLLQALTAQQERLDRAQALRLDAAREAKVTTEALRTLLREVRGSWRFALTFAAGQLPPLNLEVGREVVARRKKRALELPADEGRQLSETRSCDAPVTSGTDGQG
jgi:hypothetical protein